MPMIVGTIGLSPVAMVDVQLTFWDFIAVTFLPSKRSALERDLRNCKRRSWRLYKTLGGHRSSLMMTPP